MTLRLREGAPDDHSEASCTAEHESLGGVPSGIARPDLEGQEIRLEPGDCGRAPTGARHRNRIETPFTAVEVTAHGATGRTG